MRFYKLFQCVEGSSLKRFKVPGNRSTIVLLLATYLAYQCIKGVRILFEGRFWGEEGAMYWAHALSSSAIDHFLFVAPIADYYLLNANLQTGVASLLPHEFAPLFCAWTSLIWMMAPALFFIYFRFPLRGKRDFLILLALLLGPAVTNDETFANSINSQTYLGLSSMVILVFGLSKPRKNLAIQLLALTLGAFSGWYTIALLPLFIWNFLKRQNRAAFASMAVVTVGLIAQASVFISRNNSGRVVVDRLIVLPSVPEIAKEARQFIYIAFFGNQLEAIQIVVFTLLTCAVLSVAMIGAIQMRGTLRNKIHQGSRQLFQLAGGELKNQSGSALFLLGAFLELGLVLLGQTGANYGGRYAVVPSTMLLLGVIQFCTSAKFAKISMSLTRLTMMVVLLGSASNLLSDFQNENYSCPNCVSWTSQLSQVEAGRRELLVFWPSSDETPDFAMNPTNPKVRLSPGQLSLVTNPSDYR